VTLHPLLAGFASNDILAWRGNEPLTAGQALAAAARLAAASPAAKFAINACETLDCFVVATLATLVVGRTLVLPPTRLPRTLADLRERYPDSVCLVDAAMPDPAAIAVGPWIDAARREPSPAVAAWPAISDRHPAVILFTSGSTGAPQPHAKTWAEFAQGARALMNSIAAPPPGVAIVGTVPPQHMFGFETTVALPLQSGTPVLTARPVFAADLVDALAQARALAPAGVWLMTTPLQLRAFHRERAGLRGVARIIASTMPLDPALARAVERDWNTTVDEIYGCTEGGILAVRRAGVTTAWTPAAGVTFAIAADGRASAAGGHLRGALALADRLRPVGTGGAFELEGRDGDLVKIGGKRASLAGLTRELLAVAGVSDGVVFLPEADAPRVAALAVAPGRTIEDIRVELAERVDAAFLPRTLRLVDALPRNAGGKLPLEALRALVAGPRNAEIRSVPRELTSTATIATGHPALPGHFPGRPIVPGTLLLASVEELLSRAGMSVVGCVQAKFHAPVSPGQSVTIRVDVSEPASTRFEITAADKTVVAGTFRCVAAGIDP